MTEASPGYGQSAAATTCSATSSSAMLTGCASVAGFTVGRKVNVAYAGVAYQDLDATITSIVGSTIALDTSARKSVTNVAVNQAQHDLLSGLPSGSLIENVTCGGAGQQNYVSTPLGKDFVVSLADSVGNGSGTFGGFQVLSAIGDVPDITFRTDGQSGHITIGGLQPSVSCGTGATIQGGNDNVGRLTCGTSPGSTVVVTFASSSWPNSNPPVCEAVDETRAVTFRPSSVSTSAVTFTATGTIMASDAISWSCRSYF